MKAAMLAVVFVTACGAARAPSKMPTRLPDYELPNCQSNPGQQSPPSGTTVHLHIGRQAAVDLRTAPPFDAWRGLRPSTHGVVNIVAGVGRLPGRPNCGLDAALVALAPGQTIISAYEDAACFHVNPQCDMPSRLWHITVDVDR